MVVFSLGTAVLALGAALGVTAAPRANPADSFVGPPMNLEMLAARQQRFATQYWANDWASLNWTSGQAGKYTVNWNNPNGGNFVVGKGYSRAGNFVFNYAGNFTANRGYLCVYGWTTNPLVEYYVIENMGYHHPADNPNSTCHGRHNTDNSTYEVWDKWRINAPSIIGDADFQQYWSVRTVMRVGGAINLTNHFNAFRRAGLPLGNFQAVHLAVEGQIGRGQATLTAGVTPTTTPRTTPTPTTRTELRPSRVCTRPL